MLPKAVIIGAGALGLGFLGERLAQDYVLCFVDMASKAELLRQLHQQQSYVVNVCSLEKTSTRKVSGVFDTLVSHRDMDSVRFADVLQRADLVFTATSTRNLGDVISCIAPVLNARERKRWLLFCENGRFLGSSYRDNFLAHVVLVDTVMSRMCRFASVDEEGGFEPLWPGFDKALVVEDYNSLPLDQDVCGSGPFSKVFLLVSHEQFACWQDMKFYLHNGMHAFVSYHAYLEGVKFYPQVPASIRARARRAILEELVPAIVSTHPVANGQEIEAYGIKLLERFFNPFFNDTIERGIRGVEEKLAPQERLLSGCRFIRRAGFEPREYASTILAARRIIAGGKREELPHTS